MGVSGEGIVADALTTIAGKLRETGFVRVDQRFSEP
jgi:hypothetical protein